MNVYIYIYIYIYTNVYVYSERDHDISMVSHSGLLVSRDRPPRLRLGRPLVAPSAAPACALWMCAVQGEAAAIHGGNQAKKWML